MRYQIKQRLLSLTSRFDIANESGDKILQVNRTFGVRAEYVIRSLDGQEFVRVRQKLMSWRPRFDVLQHGERLAVVMRRFTLRPTYSIDLQSGGRLTVTGSFWEHSYQFRKGDETIATVSRGLWSLSDNYGVEVFAAPYDAVVLATVIAIDAFRAQNQSS